jgi:hypothetical protein
MVIIAQPDYPNQHIEPPKSKFAALPTGIQPALEAISSCLVVTRLSSDRP